MAASNISNRIRPLPPLLIDKIAAGEVIDGPYSIIKELAENSLDAGASRIRIDTTAGGTERIVVQDDGEGIHYDDLPAGIDRHATSKIIDLADIEEILTFGFRGEALASIAAISRLELKSLRRGESFGGFLECRGGELLRHEPLACNPGTIVSISDLFFSTPARKKFLKSERTENARNYQEIVKIALANPAVSFIYYRDGREFLNLPAVQDLKERIASLYQKDIAEHLIEIDARASEMSLRGFITDESFFRANRDGQFQYVNGRHVELKNFSFLVRKAYDELLPRGSHPYFFLFLEMDPKTVDVNVHPAKKEVRLQDPSRLNSLVIQSVSDALRPGEPVAFSRFYKTGRTSGARSSGAPFRPGAARFPDAPETSADRLADHYSNRFATPFLPGESGFTAPTDRLFADDPDSIRTMPAYDISLSGIQEEDAGLNRQFLPRRHFGVIFGAYILAEGDDGFYIIDQHTAHERINYERVRKNLEGLSACQPLLTPVTIDCEPDELAEILEKSEQLLACGFALDQFGPRACIVREVPAYIEPGTETEAIQHVIRRILDGEDSVRIYDELAAMKACKASIKRNDVVVGETLSEILVQLSQCADPSRCPHGRPTMIRLSREDLDRMFGRL